MRNPLIRPSATFSRWEKALTIALPRQRNRYRRPLADGAADIDAPAVRDDQRSRDRQSEAGAVGVAAFVEPVENSRQIIRRDSAAGVGDSDDESFWLHFGVNEDGSL